MPQLNVFKKVFLLSVLGAVFGAAAFGQCPAPTPTINSPNIPTDVSIPANFQGNPICFFDDYSWQAFLALVWPAKMNGQTPLRGTPDIAQKNFPTSAPLVFETYKADWETFQPQGAPPSAWQSYAATTPCATTNGSNQFTLDLASFSMFGNLGQTTFSTTLAGPLVVQNAAYTRFLASYNDWEFNAILNQKWYLLANVPTLPTQTPIKFPTNSIDLKSAWVLVTPAWTNQQIARFYTTTAMVQTPGSTTCTSQQVALVGLHIVQKTPTRPEWIWTTFEQVDNVPANPLNPAVATFNKGNGVAMPGKNPIAFPPPAQAPSTPCTATPTSNCLFNVDRLVPINPSTIATNAAYQAALKAAFPQVPWQYYELTMTQWPIKPQPVPSNPTAKPPITPATVANTFPGTGDCPLVVPPAASCSAFANTTMESFDQVKVGTGCMNCHNAVLVDDLVWSLQMNAYSPPTTLTAAARNKMIHSGSFHDMEVLLKTAESDNKAEEKDLAKKRAAAKQ